MTSQISDQTFVAKLDYLLEGNAALAKSFVQEIFAVNKKVIGGTFAVA